MYAGIYSHSTMNQNKPMFVFLASYWTKFYEVFSYFIGISSHQYIETHYLWKNRSLTITGFPSQVSGEPGEVMENKKQPQKSGR